MRMLRAAQPLLVLISLLPNAALGQNSLKTWTGADANNNWSSVNNWSSGKPLYGDSIVFGASANTNIRADFSAYAETHPQALDQPPLHLGSLTFSPAAPSYTIELYYQANSSTVHQSNLALNGAGVVNFSGQAQTFAIDQSTPSLFNYPDASSITFNNSTSAANATYNAEGGSTQIQTTIGGQEVAARSSGGRVIFNDTATAGTGAFTAGGGSGNGGGMARIEFREGSTAAGGAFTSQGGVNGPSFGNTQVAGFGGQTNFFDTASAGSASFTNQGNAAIAGSGGLTSFANNSTAASGIFDNQPATIRDGANGATLFLDDATAGNGIFTNHGASVELATGGATQFTGNSTAAGAAITNLGGTSIFAHGGRTIFDDASTAGSATITNAGPTGLYAFVGKTLFNDAASAGNATITNLPSDGGPTTTDFYDNSTAGSATIINRPGTGMPGVPTAGITTFHNSSSAGSSTLINEDGPIAGGAQFVFNDSSTAGQATITNEARGGLVIFKHNSTAGQATIVLRKEDSRLQFYDDASAGAANIDIGRLTLGPQNEFHATQFYGKSTAANSTITVRGDGGRVSFAGDSFDIANPTATAGHAVITALGSNRPGNIPGTIGGQVQFNSFSTAGNATVTAQAATVAGAPGGSIVFLNGGHAGAATLIANGGPSAANGGGIRFQGGGMGDSARLVVNAGAYADFSSNESFGGTSVGSIEGAGRFLLGGSLLTVGNRNTSTTVNGNIADAGGYQSGVGGRLTKLGTGQLTLNGANTYTGLTTIDAGALAVSGSISGDVTVNSGGTLKGTGTISGTVTVNLGGNLAPGNSPGTITVGGLNVMPGGIIDYELGASRDRIIVNGNVSLAGILNISLLDGFIPGEPIYPLFEGAIGSISGTFSAVNAPVFNGKTLGVVYGANQVTLQVVDAADFNGDGAVDGEDLDDWKAGFGIHGSALHTQGDADGDLDVDGSDFLTWQRQLRNVPSINAARAVPEPSAAAHWFAGVLFLGACHNWNRFRHSFDQKIKI